MILVDNRVGSKELERYIQPQTHLTILEYADFAFSGNGPDGTVVIGIERKTIGDLVNSIMTGRLSGHQLIGLLDSYDYIYVLVEGIWRSNPKNGILEQARRNKWYPITIARNQWMGRDVKNYLNSISIMCGVFIWCTTNRSGSGQWISDTYHWWQKPWDQHKAHKQFHQVEPPRRAFLFKPSLLHRMIKEIPGVGWDKGKLVADEYHTMEDLLKAEVKDLMKIPGIGKKIAENIIGGLRGA